MTQLLVVAVTRAMGNNCVGALDPSTGDSFRLLDSNGEFQPSGAFAIGELQNIEGSRPAQILPPHVEDFWVTSNTRVGAVDDVKSAILAVVTPWTGSLMGPQVYEGKLGWTGKGRGYVDHQHVPSKSTWFWITDSELTLQSDGKYFAYSGTRYALSYVGVSAPPATIATGTLVRLSLARWWAPEDSDFEERCYLQLSGHY